MFAIPELPTPQISGNDPAYTAAQNQFVAQANDALAAYRNAYEASMRAQGISVSWSNQGGAGPESPIATPNTYTAVLTKDGFSVETTISVGRAQLMTAEELAYQDRENVLKFQARIAPGENLPSPWFAPPTSTPGPTPTATVQTTVQPTQAPSNPGLGTVPVSPTAVNPSAYVPMPTSTTPAPTGSTPPNSTGEGERRTMWEWNWLFEQKTGKVGPDPYALGVDPAELLTSEEWWTLSKSWYSPGSATPPSTPTSSGAGSSGGSGSTGGAGGGTGAGNGGNGDGTKADDNTGIMVLALAAGVVLLLSAKGN